MAKPIESKSLRKQHIEALEIADSYEKRSFPPRELGAPDEPLIARPADEPEGGREHADAGGPADILKTIRARKT